MKRIEAIPGQLLGRVAVVAEAPRLGRRRRINLLCHCGEEFVTDFHNALRRLTTQCQRCAVEARAQGCRKDDAPYMMAVRRYRYQAKQDGREFALTNEEAAALMKQDCHYCGAPPANFTFAGKITKKYSGIDRQDNSRGYVSDNVVACCIECNSSKRNKPLAGWLDWVRKINSRHPAQ